LGQLVDKCAAASKCPKQKNRPEAGFIFLILKILPFIGKLQMTIKQKPNKSNSQNSTIQTDTTI
jgi:hypothetical protein